MHVDADVISMGWNDPLVQLGVSCLGTQMIAGSWAQTILVNGVEQSPAGRWVCTCWFRDGEVAFAELEAGSANGVRHVRHVLLALDEHFAVLTDTVTAPTEDAEVTFESRLPILNFTAASNSITRDIRLEADRLTARAVPTWLEDDRLNYAAGDCQIVADELILSARGAGGLALPLLLDWHPERKTAESDWSRLTVTEDRSLTTPWQAAGFRARVGRLQLLLFRSLRRGQSLRAVLGYNTANETVYGQINHSGQIAPLVLVEADA